MEELTREIAVQKHRELWSKIAEILNEKANEDPTECDGKKLRAREIKKMALHMLGETRRIKDNCYACKYDDQFYPAEPCSHCPFIWGGNSESYCYEAEYCSFECALYREDFNSARETALEIVNLPEREGA